MSSSLRRGPSGLAESVAGVLEFTEVAPGSKSSHAGPVLRTAGGGVRVYVIGDNPFENATLRPLSGMALAVRGVWHNGVLRIEPDALRAGAGDGVEDGPRDTSEPTE